MHKLIYAFIIFLMLTGCSYIPMAETLVDKSLATSHESVCGQHYPLRAYVAKYGNNWDELVAFCGCGAAPELTE